MLARLWRGGAGRALAARSEALDKNPNRSKPSVTYVTYPPAPPVPFSTKGHFPFSLGEVFS